MSNPPPVTPETKDWTWVLDRPCPECGFVAAEVDVRRLGTLLRDNARQWTAVLDRPGAGRRPEPQTWSALEYGCHVRDVNRTMLGRLTVMLDQDAPTFPNWDQDATAVADRYHEQAPATVAAELVDAAEAAAVGYDSVADADWDRPGTRSNGSHFTVDTFGRYHLHDVVHHLHDVNGA